MNGDSVSFNSCVIRQNYLAASPGDHIKDIFWTREQSFIPKDLRDPVRVPLVVRNTMTRFASMLRLDIDRGILIGAM